MEHILIVSDTHINSTVALAPPTLQLDDGGVYHASRPQRWLWDCWNDFARRCARMDGKKILILNGDLAELDTKRRSIQLISFNKATIQRLVLESLSPLIDIADVVIVIRGTPAHSGKSAWIEEAIANDLAAPSAVGSSRSGKHFMRVICVGLFASLFTMAWTKTNEAKAIIAVLFTLPGQGTPCPDHITDFDLYQWMIRDSWHMMIIDKSIHCRIGIREDSHPLFPKKLMPNSENC